MKTKAFKPTRNKLAQAVVLGILALAANQAQATTYDFSDLGTITGPYAQVPTQWPMASTTLDK